MVRIYTDAWVGDREVWSRGMSSSIFRVGTRVKIFVSCFHSDQKASAMGKGMKPPKR